MIMDKKFSNPCGECDLTLICKYHEKMVETYKSIKEIVESNAILDLRLTCKYQTYTPARTEIFNNIRTNH